MRISLRFAKRIRVPNSIRHRMYAPWNDKVAELQESWNRAILSGLEFGKICGLACLSLRTGETDIIHAKLRSLKSRHTHTQTPFRRYMLYNLRAAVTNSPRKVGDSSRTTAHLSQPAYRRPGSSRGASRLFPLFWRATQRIPIPHALGRVTKEETNELTLPSRVSITRVSVQHNFRASFSRDRCRKRQIT